MTRFENKRDGVEGGGVNKAETLGRRFSQRVVVDLFFFVNASTSRESNADGLLFVVGFVFDFGASFFGADFLTTNCFCFDEFHVPPKKKKEVMISLDGCFRRVRDLGLFFVFLGSFTTHSHGAQLNLRRQENQEDRRGEEKKTTE